VGVIANQPVGTTQEKRSGQFRVFYVEGCKKSKVVQYAWGARKFKPPPGDPSASVPQDITDPWHLDGADPYPGAQANGDDVISSDIPASYQSLIEADASVRSLPKGATVTDYWVLETFFYCDGALIAWVTWGGSVTFTMGDGGKLTADEPKIDAPKFHGPDEPSQSPGNPKK
jgi:hypothetical protein